jgi:hypothetical protein
MKSILSSNLFSSAPLSSDLRYELKLASDRASAAQARSWIRLHPEGFQAAYPPREINNLYFDTADLQSFNDNLSGINARRKLRIRWYGVQENRKVSNPFLELKIKENMLGDKKRQQLDVTLDLTRPYAEILETIRAQSGEKWRSRLLAFTQPTLINRYRREYFVSPDATIRATLDYDLVSYDQRMGSRPNLDRRQPLPAFVMIEVKSAPEYHKRLQRVMGYFPLPRSRSSKYVSGVMGGPF